MIGPSTRTLLTSALAPPEGMRLAHAVGTTYSLDPTTFLEVPLTLALQGMRPDQVMDPVLLLHGIQSTSQRIQMFLHCGRMQVSRREHALYGLLEPMLSEIALPERCSFHPKFWVLRFESLDGTESPAIRLIVTSRNLTQDRSWDLLLHMDGQVTGRNKPVNHELADLIRDLPGMAKVPPVESKQAWILELAEDLRRTEWEAPTNTELQGIYVLRDGKGWLPTQGQDSIAVMSPFVDKDALAALGERADAFSILISRSESLDGLPPSVLEEIVGVHTLTEMAETEDGEDEGTPDSSGLHAKAYLMKRGWNSTLVMGSANATRRALIDGRNVEVLVELTGKYSKVGTPESWAESLKEVLVPWTPSDSEPISSEEKAAQALLEEVRDWLVANTPSVRCIQVDAGWKLELSGTSTWRGSGLASLSTWPLSVGEDFRKDAMALLEGERIELGPIDLSSVTGLMAFEVDASGGGRPKIRFALNLPLENPPQGREGAVLALILRNREGFMRYLMSVLAEPDDPYLASLLQTGESMRWGAPKGVEPPILETLLKALQRDRKTVSDRISRVLASLDPKDRHDILPEGFEELWKELEAACREGR